MFPNSLYKIALLSLVVAQAALAYPSPMQRGDVEGRDVHHVPGRS